MTINQAIIEAVTPIVEICEPDVYDGEAREYVVFNYSERGTAFGDGEPSGVVFFCQIHLYMPLRENSMAKRKRLKNALLEMGFTYPTVANASDSSGQHFVFECEFLEAP